VPEDLAPLGQELLDFWSVKDGARSPVSWSRLLNEVRRIRDHDLGGIEVAKEQLSAGIQAGWQSIRCDKWLEFNQARSARPGRITPAAPGLEHLQGARPSRTEVGRINFLRAMEQATSNTAQPVVMQP
jgi:hypothetical protein